MSDSGLEEALANLTICSENNLANNELNLNNSILNNSIMAPPTLDTKLFAFVPTFDGNTTHLNKFIQSIESLITTYWDSQNLANCQNDLIIRAIRSKICGEAEEALLINNAETWADIKKL